METHGSATEIKWIGGVSPAQDVAIRLVQFMGATDETLTVVKVHSTVLSTHSKYFNTCLTERWRNLKDSPESSCTLSFVLEAQADVDTYFHCFARMYAPLLKNDRDFDVKFNLELLKVASQIEFDELMEFTALALSSAFWSKENEIEIREYSSSPDFPRNHAKDLTARLGLDSLDKSELEDRHKRLWLAINQIVSTAVKPSAFDDVDVSSARAFVAGLLQNLSRPAIPYNFAKKVIKLFNRKAKGVLAKVGEICAHGRLTCRDEEAALCWALKALLVAKLAEELVPVFLQFKTIPRAALSDANDTLCLDEYEYSPWVTAVDVLAEVVFLIYEEVVAGRLVLRTPERVALLANWHPVLMKACLIEERKSEMKSMETKLNLITRQLFSTLPSKEQVEFIKSQKNVDDFISNCTAEYFHWPVMELDHDAISYPAIDPP